MGKQVKIVVCIFFFFGVIILAWQLFLTKYFLIEGEINQHFEKRVTNQLGNRKSIVIYSNGGNVTYSISLANKLNDHPKEIIIFGECLSACAEYLLPSANDLKFFMKPMIGFHDNIFLRHHFLHEEGMTEKIKICYLPKEDILQKIYHKNNLNIDFWRETSNRLKIRKVSVRDSGYFCPYIDFWFENHMWLPTSQQLRELWGLEFEGSVCADDFERCKRKIDRRWENGTSIVVGDKIYVSQGK